MLGRTGRAAYNSGMARPTTPASVRVWSKVTRGKPSECWLWHGAKNERGYGIISNAGKRSTGNTKAHRAAWESTHGPIPPGLFCCHSCHVPACCNPNHLFLGTQAANMADARAKGRVPPPPIRYGSDNNKSKLTASQVREIRSRLADGEGQTALGREFGVSQAAVWYILHRRNWAHLV